ncbi:hypothetical protein GCM10009718_25130 [Isoptericola halotolerans]|uniref:class F sortase n=1 Tax=Isoptericola halotolerans TaxID=300560 RepID=UPI0031E142A5
MTADRRRAAFRASRPVSRTAAAVLLAGAVAGGAALVTGTDDGDVVGSQVPRTESPTASAPDQVPVPDEVSAPEPTAPPTGLPEVPVVRADPVEGSAAADPQRLRISGLLDVPVSPVGVEADGTMELPGAGDVAGWYRFGPAPGDDVGTVVLASHVDTIDGVGAFAGLTSVSTGDVVVVTDEDGERHRYTVSTVERFSKEVVPLDEIFDRTGERRLALVTCGGRWDAQAGHYEDNLVVTAVA